MDKFERRLERQHNLAENPAFRYDAKCVDKTIQGEGLRIRWSQSPGIDQAFQLSDVLDELIRVLLCPGSIPHTDNAGLFEEGQVDGQAWNVPARKTDDEVAAVSCARA